MILTIVKWVAVYSIVAIPVAILLGHYLFLLRKRTTRAVDPDWEPRGTFVKHDGPQWQAWDPWTEEDH